MTEHNDIWTKSLHIRGCLDALLFIKFIRMKELSKAIEFCENTIR